VRGITFRGNNFMNSISPNADIININKVPEPSAKRTTDRITDLGFARSAVAAHLRS